MQTFHQHHRPFRKIVVKSACLQRVGLTLMQPGWQWWLSLRPARASTTQQLVITLSTAVDLSLAIRPTLTWVSAAGSTGFMSIQVRLIFLVGTNAFTRILIFFFLLNSLCVHHCVHKVLYFLIVLHVLFSTLKIYLVKWLIYNFLIMQITTTRKVIKILSTDNETASGQCSPRARWNSSISSSTSPTIQMRKRVHNWRETRASAKRQCG